MPAPSPEHVEPKREPKQRNVHPIESADRVGRAEEVAVQYRSVAAASDLELGTFHTACAVATQRGRKERNNSGAVAGDCRASVGDMLYIHTGERWKLG